MSLVHDHLTSGALSGSRQQHIRVPGPAVPPRATRLDRALGCRASAPNRQSSRRRGAGLWLPPFPKPKRTIRARARARAPCFGLFLPGECGIRRVALRSTDTDPAPDHPRAVNVNAITTRAAGRLIRSNTKSEQGKKKRGVESLRRADETRADHHPTHGVAVGERGRGKSTDSASRLDACVAHDLAVSVSRIGGCGGA
uniref:OSJNBb0008G24.29 protein n=1 Tax=Oryza sativa subsp. japonica TaxID=39947 RepID=Q8RV58_ORYSJ|nr:OSJNBb0008G24.29 [Oryza sativa Japonica Group]